MHRFSAWVSVTAMLVALATGPLFHVHDRDDHGAAGSIIHAHFLELEDTSAPARPEVENQHSHRHATWIDVFVLSAPATMAFHAIAEFSERVAVPSPALDRLALSLHV